MRNKIADSYAQNPSAGAKSQAAIGLRKEPTERLAEEIDSGRDGDRATAERHQG